MVIFGDLATSIISSLLFRAAETSVINYVDLKLSDYRLPTYPFPLQKIPLKNMPSKPSSKAAAYVFLTFHFTITPIRFI